MTDKHGTAAYGFPKQVIPPEASQDETYDILMPDLLRCFLSFNDAYNVLYFAYGQTGTGKTHSIFGPKWALNGVLEENQAQWGMFPRAFVKIMEYMKRVKESPDKIHSILTVGAIDFYVGNCVDLLNHREHVEVDDNRVPLGYTERELVCLEDVISFLQNVLSLRKSFGTLMNESTEDHDGSSRSHCALILTLRQVKKETGECVV
eukprot:CAMPEP_0195529920 /NCGR_PEP_ID=MMETSP0794_2-20130614/32581_1 /TAXON_ID=515487 /ORGANISM="Stephanopyxis turris, Strain CCMP 815" /LENGTH=204 /DNA_ID=CAMNT_0040661301 /DNA_START=304 /DNA_END=914 /DNA_ORIENTATION=+